MPTSVSAGLLLAKLPERSTPYFSVSQQQIEIGEKSRKRPLALANANDDAGHNVDIAGLDFKKILQGLCREGKIFQDLLTLYRQNFGAACKDAINSLRNFVKLEECCPVYKETRVIHAVFASDGTSKSMGALLASIMFFHCCDAETALSYLLKKPRAWNPLPLIDHTYSAFELPLESKKNSQASCFQRIQICESALNPNNFSDDSQIFFAFLIFEKPEAG